VGRLTEQKKRRLNKIHAYLTRKYVTPFPTTLIILGKTIDKKVLGTTSKSKRRIYIAIDGTMEQSRAIETLAHEYAHAMTWTYQSIEDVRPHHCPEWGLAYARVYHDLWEDGGLERIK
jgi:Zn-dependent peptidase ImmA (M78 family)